MGAYFQYKKPGFYIGTPKAKKIYLNSFIMWKTFKNIYYGMIAYIVV